MAWKVFGLLLLGMIAGFRLHLLTFVVLWAVTLVVILAAALTAGINLREIVWGLFAVWIAMLIGYGCGVGARAHTARFIPATHSIAERSDREDSADTKDIRIC
jgi:hypothetical protein